MRVDGAFVCAIDELECVNHVRRVPAKLIAPADAIASPRGWYESMNAAC